MLRKLFSLFGQDNHVAARSYTTPPVPEGQWQLIVDINGDIVKDRAPIATDSLARRPAVQLSAMGGETYPPYVRDPRKDRDHNGAAYIAHAVRSRRNMDHLEKAIFLLSQTDDGIRLLHMAQREKFKIVFDSDLCVEEGAVGLCDYSQKKIPLAEGRSAAEVALTLKHELQHMEDIKNGLSYAHTNQPRNAVFANRALESNARVSESVAAAELLLGSPDGPERQFRSGALFDNIFHKNPPVAKAAHAALADAKAGNWQDFAAKVFPAYFQQTPTLTYYDNRYAKMLSNYAPDVRDSVAVIADPEKFRKLSYEDQEAHRRRVAHVGRYAPQLFTASGLSPDEAVSRLTIRGLSYTEQLKGKKFDINADANVAITPEAQPAYDTLRETLEKAVPAAGLHQRLELPAMKPLPFAAMPSPYKGQTLGGAEAAFAPIVMPHRLDGHTTFDPDKRSHAVSTESAMASITSMNNHGGSDFDRLHFGINEFFHKNNGYHSGTRGPAVRLLETGFLAPIAAFPANYVQDLYARVVLAAEASGLVDNNLDRGEVRLFGHWQDMKDKGFDPIWQDDKTKKASFMSKGGRDDHFWEKYLASLLGDKPQKPVGLAAQPVAAMA